MAKDKARQAVVVVMDSRLRGNDGNGGRERKFFSLYLHANPECAWHGRGKVKIFFAPEIDSGGGLA
jgi:hypothetical protein